MRFTELHSAAQKLDFPPLFFSVKAECGYVAVINSSQGNLKNTMKRVKVLLQAQNVSVPL